MWVEKTGLHMARRTAQKLIMNPMCEGGEEEERKGREQKKKQHQIDELGGYMDGWVDGQTDKISKLKNGSIHVIVLTKVLTI